eukprot:scaffold13351_cov200-Amphora_coffeaeformis.AAC.5
MLRCDVFIFSPFVGLLAHLKRHTNTTVSVTTRRRYLNKVRHGVRVKLDLVGTIWYGTGTIPNGNGRQTS